jgi:molecular chaperone HtpG
LIAIPVEDHKEEGKDKPKIEEVEDEEDKPKEERTKKMKDKETTNEELNKTSAFGHAILKTSH